jgi:hypothetical protein
VLSNFFFCENRGEKGGMLTPEKMGAVELILKEFLVLTEKTKVKNNGRD